MMAALKLKYKQLPVLVRVLIYIGINFLLIFLVQVIMGLLGSKAPIAFNLLLCILLLLFTRYVLWLEGMSFKTIGVDIQSRPGYWQLLTGTLVGIAMLVITALCMQWITGFHWKSNPAMRYDQLGFAVITIFCSVFAQELAFRGYPFRLMLDAWGEWPTQIITAILFGCMHLHEGMTVKDVLLTMLFTGAGSVLFGMAVIGTGRLHLAIGIHFGWNYTQYLLPRHPSQNGDGLVLVQGGNFDISWLAWTAPYLTVLLIVYFLIRVLKNKRKSFLHPATLV